MRKNILAFILGMAMVLWISPDLMGYFQYRVDFTSRYIWRGFDLNPNKQPALQPSLEYGCGDCGFTFSLWSSFSFSDRNANEIDLAFTYDFRLRGNLSLNAGFIHYGWSFVDNFSFREDTTQELFISAALPKLCFHPRLTVFYDFGNGDGFYILLEGSYAHRFSGSVKGVLSGSLGYNGGQWLAEGSDPGFSDANLGADLIFRLGRFTVSPFLRLTRVLLEAIGRQTHFWFGLSISYQ